MSSEIQPAHVAAYVGHATRGDEGAAWDLVGPFLADLPRPIVMRDLVAKGQEQIGLCWQEGRCTVQQEHTATAVSHQMVKRMAAHGPPRRPRNGVVVLLASEGDWHSIATTMLHATLVADGWSVVPLPPGTTAGQLGSVMHDHGPVAVAVTCSMPALLPGARRIVTASQDAGTPVIVGGRAFGQSPGRAQRINANGWSRDLVDASATIAAHAGFSAPSVRIEHPMISEYSLLRSQLGTITASIQDLVPSHLGGDAEQQVGAALWIVRSVAAALLCADATILAEDVAWSRDRSRSGAPAFDPLVELLLAALPDELPHARRLLADAQRAAQD